MLRIILYNIDGKWQEGILHGFNEKHAIIESVETGELILVPVGPDKLKFKAKIREWVAEQQAQQQQRVTAPLPPGFGTDRVNIVRGR